MRDDVAFRSQEFAEQVANRRDRYAAWNIDTWNRLPETVSMAQQAQAQQQAIRHREETQQAEMLQSSHDLALSELKRQQAAQELQFANSIHQTDMIELEKRKMRAQVEFEEARLDNERRKFDLEPRDLLVDTERMSGILSLGLKPKILAGGRVEITEADPNDPDVLAAKQLQAQQRDKFSQDISLAWLRMDEWDRQSAIVSGTYVDIGDQRATLTRATESQVAEAKKWLAENPKPQIQAAGIAAEASKLRSENIVLREQRKVHLRGLEVALEQLAKRAEEINEMLRVGAVKGILTEQQQQALHEMLKKIEKQRNEFTMALTAETPAETQASGEELVNSIVQSLYPEKK